MVHKQSHPMPESANAPYIVFDRAADYYDATRGFPQGEEAAIAALIAQVGNLDNSNRLLEVGIGTGRIALPLATHVGRLCGVDLSRTMMGRLQMKAGAAAIRLSEANALRLPFRRAAFDAVVLVHVLHLIADWQGVLGEIARVLTPEGLLLCGGDLGNALHSATFEPIWAAWRAALPEGIAERIGLTQPVGEALPALGWRAFGTPQRHTYMVQRSPHSVYQALASRHWSSTWRLSDEQLAQGLAAVRAAITAHFPQPEVPISVQSSFEVQAFQPPRTTH